MAINSRNVSATIGTDPVVVSEAKISGNSERVRLILTNTSTGAQSISLATDADATIGYGLVLSPGGSMAWEKQAGIPIIQSRVSAVSSVAGGTLAIYEEVLQ